MGPWLKIFKTSDEVAVCVAQRMEAEWDQRFPQSEAANCSRPLAEFQAARVKEEELKELFLKCMAWLNWFMPELQKTYPSVVASEDHVRTLENNFQAGLFDTDMLLIANARGSDATFLTTSFKHLDSLWKVVQGMLGTKEREEIKRSQASVDEKRWDRVVDEISVDIETFRVACASSLAWRSKSNLWMLSKAREISTAGKKATESHCESSLKVLSVDSYAGHL